MGRRRVSVWLAAAGVAATVFFVGATSAGAATTWTVNCPGDDLQSVIDGASSGDTIVINGTCYGNFTIDNKNSLTLRGGSAKATLNGRGLGSTLTITNGPAYAIQNLTLTNGNASQGGGLHADDASIAMTNVTVIGNVANEGGGIWSRFPFDLVLTGVTLTRNTANANGGGLYVIDGELRMTASTVSRNVSKTSFDGGGGGIWIEGVNALLTSTRVTTNSSADFGGGIAAYGGFFSGGAPPLPGASPFANGLLDAGLTLVNSSVDHNRASDDGGGIYNESLRGDAPVVLQDSTLSFNSAVSGDGGGIYNYGEDDDTASVLVTGSTFQGNQARNGDGGAVYNATTPPGGSSGTALVTIGRSGAVTGGSVVNQNQAQRGGGIANEQMAGTASVSLQSGAKITGNKASVTGGGVWNSCGSFSSLGQIILNSPNNVVSGCF